MNNIAAACGNLTLRYVIALTLIAAASVVAWANLHFVIKNERDSAALINVSGRQRMLSQRVALVSERLANPVSASQREVLRGELANAIREFDRNHRALVDGSATLNQSSAHSRAIHDLYFRDDQAIDATLATMLRAARSVLTRSVDQLPGDDADLVHILAVASGPLLDQLDLVVNQRQAEAEQAVDRINKVDDVILIGTLVLLALEAIFIFRPMVARVRRTLNRLVDEQHRSNRIAEQFQRAFQLAPHGMALLDADGAWFAVNPALCRLVGYEAAELIALGSSSVSHSDDAAIAHHALARLISDPAAVARYEQRYVTASGQIVWVDVSMVAILDGTGAVQHYLAQIIDLTVRRQLEAQAKDMVRLEAVGQVTGGVAHEFNNRLAAISGNLQLLAGQTLDDSRAERRVRAALGQVDECAMLVKRLLAYASGQLLATGVVDVPTMLDAVLATVRETLPDTIGVEIDLAGVLAPVQSDEGELKTAILALIDNAREAMPQGGALSISGRNIALADHQHLADGDYVKLTIADTGCGIPDAIKERVRQPFFTTKDVGAGAGLGLSMADGILNQVGGHLALSSAEGSGTVVRLLLPTVAATNAAAGRETTSVQHGPQPVTP